MTDDWVKRVQDPDGREVVFDVGAIERPDHRDDEPDVAGRERFYRQDFPALGQWLRVVVDFNEQPAWVVTALPQNNDPRL